MRCYFFECLIKSVMFKLSVCHLQRLKRLVLSLSKSSASPAFLLIFSCALPVFSCLSHKHLISIALPAVPKCSMLTVAQLQQFLECVYVLYYILRLSFCTWTCVCTPYAV